MVDPASCRPVGRVRQSLIQGLSRPKNTVGSLTCRSRKSTVIQEVAQPRLSPGVFAQLDGMRPLPFGIYMEPVVSDAGIRYPASRSPKRIIKPQFPDTDRGVYSAGPQHNTNRLHENRFQVCIGAFSSHPAGEGQWGEWSQGEQPCETSSEVFSQ